MILQRIISAQGTHMKLSPHEQEQIISLMTRMYTEIGAIEAEYDLFIGEGDFRSRIEYFHDAIRAYFSQDAKAREEGGRLTVEWLAYDIQCLRYIQSMPLSPFKPKGGMMSPSSDVVMLDHNLVTKPKRPDRQTKEKLVELYQHYAVLFAALLKPLADHDYHDRIDDLIHDTKDISAIIGQLEAMKGGKGNLTLIAQLAQHLEDDQLRGEVLAFLKQEKAKTTENIRKMIDYLKNHNKKKDSSIKVIEDAHLNYALSQLAVFEASRDMLKKMAAQGMNLVGKFVENSIAATRQEMGR
jgi:hypothetical protein